MHKVTAFFICLVGVLTAACVVTVWHLHTSGAALGPITNVAGIQVGFTQDKDATAPRRFEAASVVLWDMDRQSIRFEQNAYERRPIASLTKLMTAMVAVDYGIDWDATGTIDLNEYGPGGNLLLHSREFVTMRDLFHASLLGSANNATKAYVRLMKIPPEDFVVAMNRKAIELGLEQTHFTDVTGLDPGNISTAYEVARLAEVAFTQYPDIAAATSLPGYPFIVGGSGREHTVNNTNKLVSQAGEGTSGTKTGYLDEAKWCLVMKGVGAFERRMAVVLGSSSEERNFVDTRDLLHLAVP